VQILHASEEYAPQEPAVIRPLKRQGFIDGATLQALAPSKTDHSHTKVTTSECVAISSWPTTTLGWLAGRRP
jgi:hypothetical protein